MKNKIKIWVALCVAACSITFSACDEDNDFGYNYKTQNKLSVNYKTFCTDFTSINIKQNVNLEYKNKYFYICN